MNKRSKSYTSLCDCAASDSVHFLCDCEASDPTNFLSLCVREASDPTNFLSLSNALVERMLYSKNSPNFEIGSSLLNRLR